VAVAPVSFLARVRATLGGEIERVELEPTPAAGERSGSSGQWAHIDHAAVLSRGGTQRQRFVIQARLVGQDARDKSGTNSQLQFCAGGLGVVPGGERLNGHPHVRRRVVGGFFWLFPHVALPFSALDFVSE